jgi:predicted metal-dependent phosphoesterase TrpH
LIDLHLHTTCSDGTLSPETLVAEAARVGITVLAVTDHDTVAGLPEAEAAAAARGLRLVPGIEITTVNGSADVHLLAYFVDRASPRLAALLARLRDERLARGAEMVDRLRAAGAPIGDAALADAAASSRSIGRPQIARALVAAGHAASVDDAFERFLSPGRAAYVPHRGPSPADAIATVTAAGGLASLAHPGLLQHDDWIPGLAADGLSALEAYHSSHDAQTCGRYVRLASSLGLLVTGGSDYHGPGMRRSEFFGVAGLPQDDFARLDALRTASE